MKEDCMDRQGAIRYMGEVSWQENSRGLQRIAALLESMGSPQKSLRFIHVAGTNGKGSVCCMLASVLSKAGYRTGLFTSPFVNCFNERIQVDGVYITDEEVAQLTQEVRMHAEKLAEPPTEFELVTALGFLFFQKMQCDIVVLEVGLGGRLDATNIIAPPCLAVITTIGYDHTAELGTKLAKIAAEKAGIIKPGTKVVSAPQKEKAGFVLKERCKELSVPLVITQMSRLVPLCSSIHGQHFHWDGKELCIQLVGEYQLENAAVVLTALECLKQQNFAIDEQAISAGLSLANWPARLELLSENPVFFLDGGHNLQGAEVLAQSLQALYPNQKWHFVMGVMRDKDWRGMLEKVLPLAESMFCVASDRMRALPAKELAEGIKTWQPKLRAEACASIEDGLSKALKAAGNDGLVCAFGSLYTAGAVREFFGLAKYQKKDSFEA